MTLLMIAELILAAWTALLISACGWFVWEPLDDRKMGDWLWGAAATAALCFALWSVAAKVMPLIAVLRGAS